VDEEPIAETIEEALVEREAVVEAVPAAVEPVLPLMDEEGEELDAGFGEDRQRERRQRRALVFDEDAGVVVAVRRRKRGGDADEWDDELSEWDEFLD
jgi:hypothetical protein